MKCHSGNDLKILNGNKNECLKCLCQAGYNGINLRYSYIMVIGMSNGNFEYPTINSTNGIYECFPVIWFITNPKYS